MKVNVNRLDYSNYTVDVRLTGVKLYSMRIRLGMLFIRVGVWITGLSFKFDGMEAEDDAGV
jgi:hypothetical protein